MSHHCSHSIDIVRLKHGLQIVEFADKQIHLFKQYVLVGCKQLTQHQVIDTHDSCNDEPASVLLERIRAEKQRLIKEGKIKKDKHESVIFRRDNSHYEKRGSEDVCIDEELPFDKHLNLQSFLIAGKHIVLSKLL